MIYPTCHLVPGDQGSRTLCGEEKFGVMYSAAKANANCPDCLAKANYNECVQAVREAKPMTAREAREGSSRLVQAWLDEVRKLVIQQMLLEGWSPSLVACVKLTLTGDAEDEKPRLDEPSPNE